MGFQTLLSDDAAPVRTLTVNRPDVLNALNAQVLVELEQAFAGIAAEVAGDPVAVRCVILTGAGDKAFAAGADIAAMADMGPEQARRFSDLGRRLADRVEGLPVPVIAAVNGFALGGGLELALLCDFMLASSNAKLGQPEVNVGVLPGFGGTQRLGRRIGVGPARQLLYTGELVGAEEARVLGLVNEVTAPLDLLPRARALAGRIASRAPLAVAAVKRAVRAGEDLPLDRGVLSEQGEFAGLFGTADQKEGMQAFLQKRPPIWQGK
jgi:enoyl-CoA hydratase